MVDHCFSSTFQLKLNSVAMSITTSLKRSYQGQAIIVLCLICTAFLFMLHNINQTDSEISEDVPIMNENKYNPNIKFAASWPPAAIRLDNGVWNNYGVDCDIVLKIVSGEYKASDYNVSDLSIEVASSLRKKTPETGLYKNVEYKIKHRPLLNCLQEDNLHLIDSIAEDMIIKPNKKVDLNNNMHENHSEFSSHPQAMDIVDMIFNNLTKGFFVEAGASGCTQNSLSLPLEQHLNWKGILIEPLPDRYDRCKKANRKSHLINTCLGIKKQPYFTQFNVDGGLVNKTDVALGKALLMLQCLPLYSILLSMGNPTVNLFVMNIQGFELAVLETIPWQKVDIQVFSISQKDSSGENLLEFMNKRGYDRFDHRIDLNEMTKKNQKHLFARRDIVKKYNVKVV